MIAIARATARRFSLTQMFKKSVQAQLANWQRRRQFKRLLDLDDRLLDDIGLIREEVIWGAGLPLNINASLVAHNKARQRRRVEQDRLLNRQRF